MNKIFKCLIFSISVFVYGAKGAWASLLPINFSKAQRLLMQNRQSVVFKKELSPLATQILFSWNCARPKQGYFTFYMQVHDAYLKQWSEWYKVAEWGANVQRSFEEKHNHEPSFFFVRAQMPSGHFADECRIRVDVQDGASLALLYRIALASVRYPFFASEVGQQFTMPTVRIENIPSVSQMQVKHAERNRICSPTSLSMVVSYLNGKFEDPEQFAAGVYDDGLHAYGSWPFNIAHAFDRSKGRFYFSVARLNSFSELYDYLSKHLPVVVSVRGPLETMPSGKTYAEGHLLVIVGWDNDKKRVFCHDPAFDTQEQVTHAYDINEFLKAWERSYRLSYVIESREI